MACRNGAGGYPRNFLTRPETRPEPSGFGEFQSAPVKIDTKTVRIGAARGGAARVGRLGRVLPTPIRVWEVGYSGSEYFYLSKNKKIF
jgi:hypothetical protein